MIRISEVRGHSHVNTPTSDSHTLIADPPSAELLDRYFAEACTSSERARVQAWVARQGNGAHGLAMLQQMRVLESAPGTVDVDAHWTALDSRLRAQSKPATQAGQVEQTATSVNAPPQPTRVGDGAKKTRPRTPWFHSVRSPWAAMTAAVAGAILIIAGWHGGTYRLTNDLATQTSVYTTPNGAQATITLPDSSQVTLNVASQLEVPADYSTGNRTLRLKGEAMFTVAHRSAAPFTVIAGPSTTRVLGTRFVVRHYDTDTTALVSVQDGKVAVGTAVLAANQEVEVSQSQMTPVRAGNALRTGFTRGVFTLDGVQLKDAIPDLNRWFNANVQLGDSSLATRVLFGDCVTGTVANLAEFLELTFDIRVVRRGSTLTLYPKD